LLGVALFAGAVLVNGVLAMLLIELFELLGWSELARVDGLRPVA
jgi:hypothetical protein